MTKHISDETVLCADLFCGGGGFTQGLLMACRDLGLRLNLVAINHWDKAIATHARNHGYAIHYCEDIKLVKPKQAVPGGYLHTLIAGLRCTHHSRAKGGKPRSEQMRSDAQHVLRWAEDLYIETIIIENVREFMSWGPLDKDGYPIPHLAGKAFVAFIEFLKALDYTVDFRVLNCANYGDPTNRERLFIVARRGDTPIRWPEPTHSPAGGSDLVGDTQPWKPARDIINWDIPGKSIFNRAKPLAPNTMRRIFAGLKRFSGLDLEPYLVKLYGTSTGSSIDEPLPTVTAGGQHLALAQPFVLNVRGNDGYARGATIDKPLPTVTTSPPLGLVQPFVVPFYSEREGQLPRTHSVDEPLPTVTTGPRFGLVQPFLLTMEHSRKAEPFIVATNHGDDAGRCYSVHEPMRTITTVDAWGLVQPCLVKYYSSGEGVSSIDDPLPTVTTKERFGLVIPIDDGLQAVVDIHFRMLQPEEYARAHSFPESYEFEGKREDIVKQIGNSVPVETARALCRTQLEDMR